MAAYNTQKVVNAVRTRYSDFIALQSHRGHWENWPENSKWAYYEAMNKGIELLEVDLRRCSGDDERDHTCIAVQHDSNLGRVTTAPNSTLTKDITAAGYKNLWLKDRAGRVVPIRPLLLWDLLEFVKSTQSSGKSVVLIVDCKNANAEGFKAYDVFLEAKAIVAWFRLANPDFDDNALVWKLWLRHVPTNPAVLESAVQWSPSSYAPGQNLILTIWPPNYSLETGTIDGSMCGYEATQVTCAAQYAAYQNKAYMAHFELISYYPNDPLATWVSGLSSANKPMGDYWHDNVLPEGISHSNGSCCLFTYTRSEIYATSPFKAKAGTTGSPQGFGNDDKGCFAYDPVPDNKDIKICQDLRGFLDLVLDRNPTSIVSDKAGDLIPYLTNIGKRTLSRIQ